MRRLADGGWGDVRKPSLPTDAAWRMLASHGGSVLGLWSKGYYTSPGGLWGARLVSGGEWEAPQPIVESGSVIDPIDLRMSSPSEDVVIWADGALGSDAQQIRSARFADGEWWQAQNVSGVANLGGTPYPFHMVLRSFGDAVAVWSQTTTGSPSSVWSNTFVTR